MISPKLLMRQITNTAVRMLPTPLVRYVLKSYFYQQDLQNRVKYHVQPFRYESPIADVSEIDTVQLELKRSLHGLPPDSSVYYPLVDQLQSYARELQSIPLNAKEGSPFWFHNGGYGDFDAVTLYSMIRHLKPRKLVEVGCGFSSHMTTKAALQNNAENSKTECLFIEPYPSAMLRGMQLPGPLLVKKIQEVPLERFSELKAGDVLFIDTSHVLKTQNDLCYILLTILPALAKGVYVHFHDIFTPYDYPARWLLQTAFYFNEQYALEAILCNSSQFEVLLPVHWLCRDSLTKIKELLPGGKDPGCAFWIRKLA
jgi:hypothetical protein